MPAMMKSMGTYKMMKFTGSIDSTIENLTHLIANVKGNFE